MELKDFIKEAIKDISEAIVECNDDLNEIGTIVNPRRVLIEKNAKDNLIGYMTTPRDDPDPNYLRPVHMISFDMSVSTTTKKDGKEGIGVNVVGIKLGKDKTDTNSDNTASRLSFSVPIALPTHKA
ncbi:hypothetical protein [Pseudoalteromonas sp. NCIMB_1079]|uniref:hypothetical protein n=1 Tax=Pseudoalteromonas sp. NCIMB 1079 TaxID=3142847 RepID=UPI00339CEE6D